MFCFLLGNNHNNEVLPNKSTLSHKCFEGSIIGVIAGVFNVIAMKQIVNLNFNSFVKHIFYFDLVKRIKVLVHVAFQHQILQVLPLPNLEKCCKKVEIFENRKKNSISVRTHSTYNITGKPPNKCNGNNSQYCGPKYSYLCPQTNTFIYRNNCDDLLNF